MSRVDAYNLIGCLFGHLYVEKDVSTSVKNKKYKCRCVKTGETRNVRQSDLLTGKIREIGRKTDSHGMSKTSEYHAWESMIQRCTNKNNSNYKNYGARGIKVSKRWMRFLNFYIDMGAKPSKNMTLERINNNKGYSKSNCKWAPYKDQLSNTRRNNYITHNGERYTLTEFCRLHKVDHRRVSYHLSKGRKMIDILKFLKTIKKGYTRWPMK